MYTSAIDTLAQIETDLADVLSTLDYLQTGKSYEQEIYQKLDKMHKEVVLTIGTLEEWQENEE